MKSTNNPTTLALRKYLAASNDIWRLVATLYSPAIRIAGEESNDSLENLYNSLDAAASKVDWLATNNQIITEMTLARIADNFLAYLSDLLRVVMLAKPETIFSEKGKIDIRQVLEATSIEELKQEIIEERIHALSYKSVTDLATHLKTQLGFEIFETSEDHTIAVKTIETRNIIVHNRGKINQRYIDRTGGRKIEINSIISVSPSDLLRMNKYFDDRLNSIDKKAIAKFGLSCEQV